MRTVFLAYAADPCTRPDVTDTLQTVEFISSLLIHRGCRVERIGIGPGDLVPTAPWIARVVETAGGKAVFNLFEGFGDDSRKEAEFVRLLETAKIPFTGNSSKALELCLNKGEARKRLASRGVRVPRGLPVRTKTELGGIDFGFPVFVKPCNEDASVGVDADSLVPDRIALERVIDDRLKRFPGGVLVEEFIGGSEFEVAFVGYGAPRLLGVSWIDYTRYPQVAPFLGYESKWDPDAREFHLIQPDLAGPPDEGLRKRVADLALRAGQSLGCDGCFRVDLRESGAELYVLDVNPNPDLSPVAGVVRQAAFIGINCDELIGLLVEPLFAEKKG